MAKFFEKFNPNKIDIRSTIFISFTLSTISVVLIIAITLYNRFSVQMDENTRREKQILINQVDQTLDSHLRNMMRVTDTLYYNVIKNKNIQSSDVDIAGPMKLIFDVNKEHIANITLFGPAGEIYVTSPAARLEGNISTKETEWFSNSLKKAENQHFSLPHVQNLYMDAEHKYPWVISISRFAEITNGRRTEGGVLLVDIKYSGIEQIFNNAKLGENSYIYLTDSSGEIIYHPDLQLIKSGIKKENNLINAKYHDGNFQEVFEKENRIITIKTVGYTGWKIIGVTKSQNLVLNSVQNRVFVVFLFSLFIFILATINMYISSKITNPIRQLEESMNSLEKELNEASIFIGGSSEVRSLGKSTRKMVVQMKRLMDDIVKEHESKRIIELNTLQSQINPHFLYNTLDIIVWMVENERPDEAVEVVTALARLFRISLSKGKTIIKVKDEMEHVRNYLKIQKKRYKNKFEYEISEDPNTSELSCIKLIVQPIVENAIYHGMESMYDDGEIIVKSYLEDGDLYFEISDNGYGMTQEEQKALLEKKPAPSKKGSGIGLKNIQERIRLYFGEEYGITIESEPDEGTKVIIKLPSVENIDEAELYEKF